jgi:hypothetical protein
VGGERRQHRWSDRTFLAQYRQPPLQRGSVARLDGLPPRPDAEGTVRPWETTSLPMARGDVSTWLAGSYVGLGATVLAQVFLVPWRMYERSGDILPPRYRPSGPRGAVMRPAREADVIDGGQILPCA